MKKITPCIWFEKEAEEAANFYLNLFPNSKITSITRFDKIMAEAAKMPEGLAMTVAFELDGNAFLALNGGPAFPLNSSVSFIIECETQDEIDHFWYAFADGGKEMDCGWVQDKYGMTWQVTPAKMGEWMTSPDKEKTQRMTQEMLKMKKLEIETLEKAFNGE